MKKLMTPIIVIVAIIVFLALMIVPKYNSLVNADEQVDSKYAQIENQLQRRLDLIPNLVNTVKGYASHEKEIMTEIAESRSKLAGAKTPQDQAAANDELTGALSRLLVVVEKYPDLKADANFRQLMDELSGTENRIAVAREDYNEEVQGYNKLRRSFPGNIIAGMFNFEKKEYFKANPNAADAPAVDFGGNDTK
ncbi:LemA family protein [Viridibacillus sp. YIM B01967]|uniref:LemA family protein n=1 Tax=Viridibacillus soli TaxID=2798301 RepID=A0ABS1H9C3_9BACL|nr:LemA family protein [Viridibacillus soli]MBK3496014.1 LemA family protein [Viridibacillus soli]